MNKRLSQSSSSKIKDDVRVLNDESTRAPPRRTSRNIKSPIIAAIPVANNDDNKRVRRRNEPPNTSENSKETANVYSTTIVRNVLKRKRVENTLSDEKRITTTKQKLAANRIISCGAQHIQDDELNDKEPFIDLSDSDDDDHEEQQQKLTRNNIIKDVTNADGAWDCPNCNKKFGSSLGFQYHIDRFVCQPTLRPGGPIIRKGRRKIVKPADESEVLSTKTYKKIRGKVNDRTCPDCRRVFTSVTGMQYHCSKQVCKQGNSPGLPIPFDTLTPGQCFVTPYGIVEVVSDDRAMPYHVSESFNQDVVDTNIKKRIKLYQGALLKRATRDQKQLMNVAIMSLARRMLLLHAYQNYVSHSKVNEKTTTYAADIRNVYDACGEVPLLTNNTPKRKELEDPSAPASSFPDRIVECLLLPDQRPRFLGYYDINDLTTSHSFTLLDGLANTCKSYNRIFIRRRMLTTAYSLDSERYYCSACYQCFASKPGYKYHVESESCIKKAASRAVAAEKQLIAIESRALQIVDKFTDVAKSPYDANVTFHVNKTHQSQVDCQNDVERPVLTDVSAEPPDDLINVDAATLVSPDAVVAQLESELYRALGQTIGPMYIEVWRALRYRKPTNMNKLKSVKKSSGIISHSPAAKKKMRVKATVDSEVIVLSKATQSVAPEASSTTKHIVSNLAIIDVRPLAQEIDAGRYPSMKRYTCEGMEDRDTKCSICKQIEIPSPEYLPEESSSTRNMENVLPCDFCRHVEHYTCAITKFCIKYPEPCDDFICHNCIGIISTRRSRAERRRLEKLVSVYTDTTTSESHALQHQGVNVTKQKEIVSLTNGIVRDREFDCVAVQGRRLDELYILLRDARERLASSLDVEEMNERRQSLIETMFEDTEDYY